MKLVAWICLGALGLWAADPPKAVFDRAVQALVAGDYVAAERDFKQVLAQQPGNVGALGDLGILYARTNRPDLAIDYYGRALKLSPNDKAILLNLALVHLKQEAHRKALPLLERVVTLDPQHLQARQLLALCRIYADQPARAIQDLERLRAGAAPDEHLLFLLGFAYLKNHQQDAAKSVFEQMFALAGPARTQFLLGKASYESALFDKAEESFQAVRRVDPDFPGLHVAFGKLYVSQRKSAEAIQELEAALKQDANDEEARYYLGSLLVQEKRYEEAIGHLELARKQAPDSWAVWFNLGKARLQLRQAAEAVPLLRRAAELNPDDSSVYFQLAKALQADGKKEEASRAFRRAQELAH